MVPVGAEGGDDVLKNFPLRNILERIFILEDCPEARKLIIGLEKGVTKEEILGKNICFSKRKGKDRFQSSDGGEAVGFESMYVYCPFEGKKLGKMNFIEAIKQGLIKMTEDKVAVKGTRGTVQASAMGVI